MIWGYVSTRNINTSKWFESYVSRCCPLGSYEFQRIPLKESSKEDSFGEEDPLGTESNKVPL